MNWEAFISSFFGFFGFGESNLITDCKQLRSQPPASVMRQDIKKVLMDINNAFKKLKDEPNPTA
jgi:hypothetical protein